MRSKSEIKKIRLKNLNRTLNRLKDSQLYREKYGEVQELKSLSELSDMEITTKDELRNYSPNGNLAVNMKEVVGYHETSGTTGRSISTWLTKSDYDIWCDEMESVALKLTKDDIVAIRYPYALSFPAHMMQENAKRAGATYIPIDSRGVVTPHSRVVNLLIDLKVTIIACIPLELIMLAETAKSLGYNPKEDFKSLRAFYTAGELLTTERKKQIEQIWGVPIYDNFGATENGMIATACSNGHLHVVEDHFLVEALDPITFQPVKEGEKGLLAVTNLTLEANPLIRYYCGDIGIIKDGSQCGCGREGEILEHHGRVNDLIQLNGQEITMTELQNALIRATGDRVSPFWMVSYNKKRLVINVEEADNGKILDREVAEIELSKELKCECRIKVKPNGALFGRKKLMDMQLSIKPRYIADYSQSAGYPSNLDDLLKGYGTF